MFWLFIVLLIVIILLASKSGGKTSLKDKIIELLEEYNLPTNKYLREHFDMKGSNNVILGKLIKKFSLKSINDFIRISAFSQCALLPDDKFALTARAYKHVKVTKKDLDIIMDMDLTVTQAIDILTAHRFYKIKDKYLKWSVSKLKKNIKTIFELDEIPYRPIVERYKVYIGKTRDNIKELIEKLYFENPKYYNYSELKNILTISDFIDYLRKKELEVLAKEKFIKRRQQTVRDVINDVSAQDEADNQTQNILQQLQDEIRRKEIEEEMKEQGELDMEEINRQIREMEEQEQEQNIEIREQIDDTPPDDFEVDLDDIAEF